MKQCIDRLIIFSILIIIPITFYGQSSINPNEFKIGIFQSEGYKNPIISADRFAASCLNVLSEDGFNIHNPYYPNEWVSEINMRDFLLLTQNKNMQVELSTIWYYKPFVIPNKINNLSGSHNLFVSHNSYPGRTGDNVFDNCGVTIDSMSYPASKEYFRPHFNNMFAKYFSVQPYKDVIWGYHITEEASYYHPHLFTSDCKSGNWGDTSCFKYCEVPVSNVVSARSYIQNLLDSLNLDQKTVIMEAYHYHTINDTINDGEGIYNPQDYIHILEKDNSRDVFFEGSYTQFLYKDAVPWLNQSFQELHKFHYLGAFQSIDYALKYTSDVHKVISIIGTDLEPSTGSDHYMSHFHSDTLVKNANWLWFQAYNSIIHGVHGIWFWGLTSAWNKDENDKKYNWKHCDYDRTDFPINYRKYVSFLTREIRFLVNKNIISTDPNTIIATKTIFPDENCILPPIESYIPHLSDDTSIQSEKTSEKYGLRYTIRTNGYETYMIITNPLNVSIENVELDFSNVANPIIQNSIGVTILFEESNSDVNSNMYKVDRDSEVNLISNTIGKKSNIYYQNTRNKKIEISFGPLDVKVLCFISVPSNNEGDWDKIWSNYGNNRIGGHFIKDTDIFYPGDFDGDGVEELLCVGYNSNNNNDWITMLKYDNEEWHWIWSNYGESDNCILYPYRNTFVIGDYDNDGKDELLGNVLDGWTTLFKFNVDQNEWYWLWSDYGNVRHPICSYKNKFYSGDFDGDGCEELLGCNLSTKSAGLFKWTDSNMELRWSCKSRHSIAPYLNRLISGDFDGDGKTELLGLHTWATIFKFEKFDFLWKWSNYGTNDLNGWIYPPLSSDNILSGNIDLDNKDELFFIQTHNDASWAQSMDISINNNSEWNWNWNWSANPEYATPYINDWPLASNMGVNTKYLLIQTKENHPKQLLAMRKFCNSYLVNLYETNHNGQNNINFKSITNLSDNGKPIQLNTCYEIYPNPSSGLIYITSLCDQIRTIEIFDIMGNKIKSLSYNTNKVELNMLSMSSGIYIIKVTNTNGSSEIFKQIINHNNE